jgi:hypothetical protein
MVLRYSRNKIAKQHCCQSLSHFIPKDVRAGLASEDAALGEIMQNMAGGRKYLIKKLIEVGYEGYLEEERCDTYPASIARLHKAGFDIS